MSEKASERQERKKKGEKERARRKKGEKGEEEKKTVVSLLVLITASLAEKNRKNCWMEKVHLAVTFSKIESAAY